MEPRNLKKLAPAPASSSSRETPPQISISAPGPRRNLTRNACSPCKLKKAKCDGNRPACGRCLKAGDACLYEVNKRDIGRLQLLSDYDTTRLQNFEVVFGVLQNGTKHQATELFSQIRLGDSIEKLASALNPSISGQLGSLPSEQTTFVSISDSTATRSELEDPSMVVQSQSFMDLLLDQDDWTQPSEDVGHGSEMFQDGMHDRMQDVMEVGMQVGIQDGIHDGIHDYAPHSTQPDGQ
ncbi:uncharacterized protein F4812DRAFT_197257 [Daldinia caldariorum]|uniref:uncharacterized protein n=1 Tax=Daldinia caldariorum TaxID=326644 RepID=UPI0020087FB4|nr:uncharacterized protein F4812DRAFT_197257 [Daldinia caldariorum]KAI1471873.1 hypothetical protein F4812DRAFT_197257 [Daldinia caldariorum]